VDLGNDDPVIGTDAPAVLVKGVTEERGELEEQKG